MVAWYGRGAESLFELSHKYELGGRYRETEMNLADIFRILSWKTNYLFTLKTIKGSKSIFVEFARELANKDLKKANYQLWDLHPKSVAKDKYGISFSQSTPGQALREVVVDNMYFKIPRFVPKSGDVVVDVGSQYGDFALLSAVYYGVSKIYSFEPLEDVFRALKDTVELNSVRNIILSNSAVSSCDGEVEIHRVGNMAFRDGNQNATMVKCVRLDTVVKEPVDLIKIDVEGFELEVLEGSRGILERYHPRIIIEVHSKRLKSKIIEFLSEMGYSVHHFGRKSKNSGNGMDLIQNLYFENREIQAM